MDGRSRSLVDLARQLVERASSGPLPDQKRVVTNLRYIREQLEGIHRRHNTPKGQPQDESQRQQMVAAIEALYQGLEEIELGVLRTDSVRLQAGLAQVEVAALSFEKLEQAIEDLQGAAENTL